MNVDFCLQINDDLAKLDFAKAIQTAESKLRELPVTDFHAVLGLSFTGQTAEVAAWIEHFFQKSSEKITVKSLYFEMNEFDINTYEWYIDGFAYSKDDGLNLNDMEWLGDFETFAQVETHTLLTLQGFEKIQDAFETIEPDSQQMQDAKDWCEQIIIARYMELMHAAHTMAKQKQMKWAAVPIYFTEHAYDFVVRSE